MSKRYSPIDEPRDRRRRVDQLCDEFELAHKADSSHRIEDALQAADAADRPLLLYELLLIEWNRLQQVNQVVQLKDYHSRFESYSEVVDAAAASLPKATQPFEFPGGESQGKEKTPPSRIGRYEILEELGEGGFAIVYLAHDTQLGRKVALKVPKMGQFRSDQELDVFVEEAQKLSRLEADGIVRVYDAQRVPNYVYIVQQYMRGGDLSKHVRKERLSPRHAAKMIARIARALGVVHSHQFTHLDLKPQNVLLDEDGRPHVADFGMAVHENVQRSLAGKSGGTPPYMSPEQICGETHRVDGRSDIWSLGVIFYELLTSFRPFNGNNRELRDEIRHRDPRPIRQIEPSTPRELCRICDKCLSKRVSDRYQSAADLVEDLEYWLDEQGNTEPSGEQAVTSTRSLETVMPQGLRSFEAAHQDFYLSLLPGPHDRDGLPKRIRFWKDQIEKTDADETFAVGLMYGPSGCGKSSLVKAGLIPVLQQHVLTIYIEATPGDTEVRLIKSLKKRCPELDDDSLSLPDLIAQLRRRGGSRQRKVVIFIDQFEQWLHSQTSQTSESQLVTALRQCDGGAVQCVAMVRDDFWMSATNFMQALEIPLVEEQNSAAVDLFEQKHALRVLTAFGQAYEQLPSGDDALSQENEQFLQSAIEGLSEDGKVICVRLSVFAEMMKGKAWTPASLKEVGGTEGVGVSFLEETFGDKLARPAIKVHAQPIRRVLETLLPPSGYDIKGQMKSAQELQAAAGYQTRPQDFKALIAVLDTDLRLITPTEPDELYSSSSSESQEPAPENASNYYQLAHDFLVPSLREWLRQKQAETSLGRLRILLADRADLWNATKEDKQLPSLWEYSQIRLLTRRRSWSELESSMMRRADLVKGTLLASLVVVISLVGGYLVYQRREYRRSLAEGYVEQLLQTTPDGVPSFIELIDTVRGHADPMLRVKLKDPTSTDRERLHAACALAHLNDYDFEFPLDVIEDCRPLECQNIVEAFREAPNSWRSRLGEVFEASEPNDDNPEERFKAKARLAIIALHIGDLDPATQMLEFRDRPDPAQRTQFIRNFGEWHADLEQLSKTLTAAEVDDASPALLSGICLAVGKATELGAAPGEAWRAQVADWWQSHRDAGVHSASEWALRTMSAPIPSPLENVSEAAERNWKRLANTKLDLVRIAGLEADGADPEYWMSAKEVSVGLFRQFMMDEVYGGPQPTDWTPSDFQGKLTPAQLANHPAQSLSWYDAVMFCNWLSWKEKLAPYYTLETAPSGKVEKVTVNESANGFRLPTGLQWFRACQAGATTRFASGESEADLVDYAVYRKNAKLSTAPIASRMPNPWGLSDMHGNTWEWCQDPFGDDERLIKGGAWDLSARMCQGVFGGGADANSNANRAIGFRVVTPSP